MKYAGIIIKYGLFLVLAMGMLSYGCSGPSAAIKDRPSGELAKVENVSVIDSGDRTAVLIELNKPVSFSTVRVEDPPMVIVDIAGVDMSGDTEVLNIQKNPVLSVEKSVDGKISHIGRVGISLSGPVLSDVSIEGSTIVVQLDKFNGVFEMPVAVVEDEVGIAEVAVAPVLKSAEPVAAPVVAEPEVGEPEPVILAEATTVHDVVVGGDAEKPYIVIRGDGMFGHTKAFMLDYDDNIRLVVDVFNVDSYTDKDTVVVGDGLLARVRLAAHDDPEKKFRIVLDLNTKAEYVMTPSGGDIIIALANVGESPVAGDIGPSPYLVAGKAPSMLKTVEPVRGKVETASSIPADDMAITGRAVTVSAETPVERGPQTEELFVTQVSGKTILSSSPLPDQASSERTTPMSGIVETKHKVYSGSKISFDLQDAQLDKVIQLLADVAGLNLLMKPSEVQGTVTLKLQNVPWDQALDILLRLYDLDKVLEGNVLRVAPSQKLAAEEKRILKEKDELSSLSERAQDRYTKTFKVSYVDAEVLREKVVKLLSKRGEITANESTNELIVTDLLDYVNEVEALIALLDKRVNQIMIEARIVTVQTGFTQSLGISWGSVGLHTGEEQVPRWATGVGTDHGLERGVDAEGEGMDPYIMGVPGAIAGGAGLVSGMTWLLSAEENIAIDVTLSALETLSKAETLAAPKVLTLENEAASITQGTTLYVQTTSASGTKPEPLNANLSLNVTPRVTGDNYIMMAVNATNNTPSGNTPPGSTASIETQSVQTNVIVKDGDTVVLGGIYTKTNTVGDSQVPWLGRIPILGWLFKEHTVNAPTSELLIFITPKIVVQNTYDM